MNILAVIVIILTVNSLFNNISTVLSEDVRTRIRLQKDDLYENHPGSAVLAQIISVAIVCAVPVMVLLGLC